MKQEQHETREPGAVPDTGDRIRDTAHQAQEKMSETARDLRDRGEELVEEGKEKGRELADRAGDMAVSRADEEKDRLAGGMRAVARALRHGGRELPEDQRAYGRFVEGVADRVEGASRYLEEHDVDGLTRDVKRIARDHTPAFLGGAFVLGMLGARFAKSSPEQGQGGRYDRDAGRPEPGQSLDETGDGATRWRSAAPGARYPSDMGSAGRPGTSSAPTEIDDPTKEDGHARGI